MRKFLLITLVSFIVLSIKAQNLSISDSAIYSLITCSPGEEVYAKFGHTAIRVNDSISGIDVVFNYGIFSFETENFYYKFIKGETDYQLGVYDTKFFLPEYAARNSVVWEQILNLSVTEKRALMNLLLSNYEPQNRVYRYNFVFDNCATRPRDKILASLNGYVKFKQNSDSKTFRQWVGTFVGTDTWLKFGIDLVFGRDADRYATTAESEFLPENLMEEFHTADILTKNNENKRLVKERKILVEKNVIAENNDFWLFKPLSISILILIIGIIITIIDIIKKNHHVLFDTILQFITGLGGFVVLYLMLISIHPLVKNNLNILWLNPLNFFVAILIWIRPLRIALFFYQIANIILLISALIVFALSIQEINIAVFPIIVLLLMRSASWFAITKRKVLKHRNSK
ncbi:MAG: DUF4105 domain-containing protein [Paludibacter sp.]|nr:DUF4105 domain-containing protein [Paludibacter sp.]